MISSLPIPVYEQFMDANHLTILAVQKEQILRVASIWKI